MCRLNCVMAYGSDADIANKVLAAEHSEVSDVESARSEDAKVGEIQEKAGLVMTYALGACEMLFECISSTIGEWCSVHQSVIL